MEQIAFWRELEARFRALPDPRGRLRAMLGDNDPGPVIAGMNERLRVALQTETCPIESVYELAKQLCHVGRWVVDGEYISRWTITDGAVSRSEANANLEARFRTEAFVAAKAAGVVRGGATADEAVDTWLDLLKDRKSPHYGGDHHTVIKNLTVASAEMCAVLAAESYVALPTSTGTSAPTGDPTNKLERLAVWLQTELDRRKWDVHDLERQRGPSWKAARKILQRRAVRDIVIERAARALGVSLSQVPR